MLKFFLRNLVGGGEVLGEILFIIDRVQLPKRMEFFFHLCLKLTCKGGMKVSFFKVSDEALEDSLAKVTWPDLCSFGSTATATAFSTAATATATTTAATTTTATATASAFATTPTKRRHVKNNAGAVCSDATIEGDTHDLSTQKEF